VYQHIIIDYFALGCYFSKTNKHSFMLEHFFLSFRITYWGYNHFKQPLKFEKRIAPKLYSFLPLNTSTTEKEFPALTSAHN